MNENTQTLINIFQKISLTRECEKAIISEYHKDEMKTPMHMSWGEEAPIATLIEVLGDRGQYFGTYRTHALHLSLTDDPIGFFGEMFGKAYGSCGARGGSMHLCSIDQGMFNSTAIVGGNISVAVGAAYTAKLQKKSVYPVTVFGDGASDCGTFWESLNLAGLNQLPMIFLCLDNELAVHTSDNVRKGLKWNNLSSVVASFGISYHEVESADAAVVLEEVQKMVKENLENGRPCFLKAKWFRYLEHVGINADFDAGYREKPSDEELLQWDPLEQTRKSLISRQVSRQELIDIENVNNQRAYDAVENARLGLVANKKSILEHI